MAYAKRKSPVEIQKARAGNYMADVDTTGMDAEMKKTLAVGKKRKMGLFESLRSLLAKKK